MTPLTGKQYERPLSNFLESAADQGIALDTDEQVDGELVKDLNHKYLGGYDVSAGITLLVAWLHTFPEFGRAGNLRTLADVSKRGRWKTLRSVARYEQAGRLQQEMARMDPSLRHHPEECVRRVAECALGAVAAPAPPRRR